MAGVFPRTDLSPNWTVRKCSRFALYFTGAPKPADPLNDRVRIAEVGR